MQFNNSYSKLPDSFFQKTEPEKVKTPKLILWNSELADFLNINLDKNKDQKEIEAIFSGNKIAESSIPLAMAYAGHQFGRFSPQLGDGRAHLLGELTAKDTISYDVHLKGSGRTKYSRGGDGKSALGPSIREFIVSEAMSKFGVPTTRALCVVATGEQVAREEYLEGGIVTRIAPAFVRVGTFEYFALSGDNESLKNLLDYCVNRLYPELKSEANLALSFFAKVADLQADIIAKWMSFGFIHGVMNTDNTSVAGVTIDYGPCAFMDEFNFFKVFSSIDHGGRYAYGNQPKIIQWNLIKLAEALFPLWGGKKDEYAQKIQNELEKFQEKFQLQWQSAMLEKLGITESSEVTQKILNLWLKYLEVSAGDFTLSHRHLTDVLLGKKNSIFFEHAEFKIFSEAYLNYFSNRDVNKAIEIMNSKNPIYIPRNHMIEKVIAEAYQENFDELYKFVEVLKNPFTEQAGCERFAEAPKVSERVTQTFCGT